MDPDSGRRVACREAAREFAEDGSGSKIAAESARLKKQPVSRRGARRPRKRPMSQSPDVHVKRRERPVTELGRSLGRKIATGRKGSRFVGALFEFIAEKQPLKLRFPEAEIRHSVHPPRYWKSDLLEAAVTRLPKLISTPRFSGGPST